MKNKTKKDEKADAAGGEFVGHIIGFKLDTDISFELATKKKKSYALTLRASHALFGLIAETIAHAHWVDRKIAVGVQQADDGKLLVKSVQIGETFKAAAKSSGHETSGGSHIAG